MQRGSAVSQSKIRGPANLAEHGWLRPVPASPPRAAHRPACRRACPAHDAGVHLRPRQIRHTMLIPPESPIETNLPSVRECIGYLVFTPVVSEIPNFIFISRSANAAPSGTAASAPGTEPRPPRRARADDTTSTPPRAAACSCPRHAAVDSAAAHGRAPHVSSGWCAEPGGQGGLRHRARPVWTRRRVSELLRSRAKAGTRLRRAPARGAGDDALRVCSPDSNPGLADPRHYSHV